MLKFTIQNFLRKVFWKTVKKTDPKFCYSILYNANKFNISSGHYYAVQKTNKCKY